MSKVYTYTVKMKMDDNKRRYPSILPTFYVDDVNAKVGRDRVFYKSVNKPTGRIMDGMHVLEIPVVQRFQRHTHFHPWFYCDYDGDRIGYYEKPEALVQAVQRYIILTYGVELDEKEFRMEF